MEWIMIKLRVGQETFCKWGGAAASVSFQASRRRQRSHFAGNTVRLQTSHSAQQR